tara:strand:+ start:108874 stop:109368 length:495 start_codon:yes stop_codon:yes gene_type:complete
MKTNFRLTYTSLFCFSLLAFASSLFLQYGIGLVPCPLCLIARFLVLFLVFVYCAAALHNPAKRGRMGYALTAFTTASLGIVVTLRHLWMMQLPPEKVPACTPGLDYLLGTLPALEALLVVLNGSGECAQQEGQFMGISLPGWTLLVFVILAIGSLLPIIKQKKG